MPTLPKLKSGAPCQYPIEKRLVYKTAVLQFVDGSEQRFRKAPRAATRWHLELRNLSDQEAGEQLDFFDGQQGAYQPMEFADPLSGEVHENCHLDSDSIVVRAMGERRFSLELDIVAE